MPEKIAIFYLPAGAGHKQLAKVIGTEISNLSPGSQVSFCRDGLDPYDSDLAFKFGTGRRLGLALYRTSYLLTNNTPGVEGFRALLELKVFGGNMRRILQENTPDVAIFTHPFLLPAAANTLSELGIPSINYVSNLRAHRIELDPRATLTAVPTKEAYEHALAVGIPCEKLLLSGWPIASNFKRSNPVYSDQILYMSGGDGQGQVEEEVLALSQGLPDKKIVVVCGRNEALRRELTGLALENVEVLGFTNIIPELMIGSDIVITKPGPSSLREAWEVGRPTITVSGNGPQEKYNPFFNQGNGFGIHCPNSKLLPKAVEFVEQNYLAFIQAIICSNKIIPGAANTIAQAALAL